MLLALPENEGLHDVHSAGRTHQRGLLHAQNSCASAGKVRRTVVLQRIHDIFTLIWIRLGSVNGA